MGDHAGQIKIFDIMVGNCINVLDGHESEISFLGYGNSDRTIVSCAWDRVVKIHKDEWSEMDMLE